MSSDAPTRKAGARGSARGFTLVELMVAVVIGLATTLVIAQVLLFSEGQRRTTTSGSDAQINGAQAIYAIQRDIQMAGYGFASSPAIIGCEIHARFNGADIAKNALGTPTFPVALVPVQIDATDPDRNVVRVLSSSKSNFSIPTRVIPPSYDPADAAKRIVFPVVSTLGIFAGDLLLAAKDGASPCEVFRATSDPAVDGEINRADEPGAWNPAGFPTAIYNDGDVLVNLGSLVDHTYSISANNALQVAQFSIGSPAAPAPARELHANVVNLQALYGKDTDGDGIVDLYDRVTPTTNAGWQQVRSIRVAVVTRSSQYEKDFVTLANPLWDVGTTATVTVVPAAAACGTSTCVTLKVETATDEWKHYRYKVFDTVIPLRNLLWTS